jgi:subtilisin family serine protease
MVICVIGVGTAAFSDEQNTLPQQKISSSVLSTPDEKVDVIVLFKDVGTRDPAEMKQKALSMQESVMDIVKSSPEVSDVKQLWLINGISMSASKDVLERIALDPNVVSIVSDPPIHLLDTTSYFQRAYSPETYASDAVSQIEAPSVWMNGYTGKGVNVSVIDTGIYPHPDIADRIIGWADLVNGQNETPYDDNGHGTHVAGLVAGNGSSGTITGVAPEANLIGIKVFDEYGQGSTSDLILAMQLSVEMGADIITYSGGSEYVDEFRGNDTISAGVTDEYYHILDSAKYDHYPLTSIVVQMEFDSEEDADNVSISLISPSGTPAPLYPMDWVPPQIDGTGVYRFYKCMLYGNETLSGFPADDLPTGSPLPGGNWTLEITNLGSDPITYSYEFKALYFSDGMTLSDMAAESVVESGVVVVAAAGNSGLYGARTIDSPAASPSVIAVGATGIPGQWEPVDYVAWFSARGPVNFTSPYLKPDVVAPGVDVLSLSNTGGYIWKDGTSMATPMVAGVAALLLDADPTLSPADVKNAITSSAVDLGIGGPDTDYGWGRVSAWGAVNSVVELTPPYELTGVQLFGGASPNEVYPEIIPDEIDGVNDSIEIVGTFGYGDLNGDMYFGLALSGEPQLNSSDFSYSLFINDTLMPIAGEYVGPTPIGFVIMFFTNLTELGYTSLSDVNLTYYFEAIGPNESDVSGVGRLPMTVNFTAIGVLFDPSNSPVAGEQINFSLYSGIDFVKISEDNVTTDENGVALVDYSVEAWVGSSYYLTITYGDQEISDSVDICGFEPLEFEPFRVFFNNEYIAGPEDSLNLSWVIMTPDFSLFNGTLMLEASYYNNTVMYDLPVIDGVANITLDMSEIVIPDDSPYQINLKIGDGEFSADAGTITIKRGMHIQVVPYTAIVEPGSNATFLIQLYTPDNLPVYSDISIDVTWLGEVEVLSLDSFILSELLSGSQLDEGEATLLHEEVSNLGIMHEHYELNLTDAHNGIFEFELTCPEDAYFGEIMIHAGDTQQSGYVFARDPRFYYNDLVPYRDVWMEADYRYTGTLSIKAHLFSPISPSGASMGSSNFNMPIPGVEVYAYLSTGECLVNVTNEEGEVKFDTSISDMPVDVLLIANITDNDGLVYTSITAFPEPEPIHPEVREVFEPDLGLITFDIGWYDDGGNLVEHHPPVPLTISYGPLGSWLDYETLLSMVDTGTQVSVPFVGFGTYRVYVGVPTFTFEGPEIETEVFEFVQAPLIFDEPTDHPDYFPIDAFIDLPIMVVDESGNPVEGALVYIDAESGYFGGWPESYDYWMEPPLWSWSDYGVSGPDGWVTLQLRTPPFPTMLYIMVGGATDELSFSTYEYVPV